MQLTFPSLPSDPTGTSPASAARAADTGPSAAGCPGSDGFAQLLADVAGPAGNTPSIASGPVSSIGSGDATSTTSAAAGSQSINVATLVVGGLTLGIVAANAVAGGVAPNGSVVDASATADGQSDLPAPKTTAAKSDKDLLGQGDAQALAVATLPGLVVLPANTPATPANTGTTVSAGAGGRGQAAMICALYGTTVTVGQPTAAAGATGLPASGPKTPTITAPFPAQAPVGPNAVQPTQSNDTVAIAAPVQVGVALTHVEIETPTGATAGVVAPVDDHNALRATSVAPNSSVKSSATPMNAVSPSPSTATLVSPPPSPNSLASAVISHPSAPIAVTNPLAPAAIANAAPHVDAPQAPAAAPATAAAPAVATPTAPVTATPPATVDPANSSASNLAIATTAAAKKMVDLPTEKIAAISIENDSGGRGISSRQIKSALPTAGRVVAKSDPDLGIGTAEASATMPAGSTLDHPPVSAVVHAAAAVADAKPDAALPLPVSIPSTAQRAVEAVLSATERFSARDQHSVNLQFTVGGSDLNVRVEMRAGEVHTTFRTDSPELRDALSNEWQSVASQPNGERSVRLAAPVFTSTNGAATSSSGDGAPRHRHSDTQSPPPGSSTAAFSRTGGSSTISVTTAPQVRTATPNSVHLHTLA